MYSIISIKVLLSDNTRYLWMEEPTREEINHEIHEIHEIQDINNSFFIKYRS